jgi:hypothetical protein
MAQLFAAAQFITPDRVLEALRDHIGRERGIHARALARKLIGPEAGPAAERQLRTVITELRAERGAHICGTPESGYYLAANEGELLETCEFLHSRAMTTLVQVSRMRGVALPDLRGQLRLPT